MMTPRLYRKCTLLLLSLLGAIIGITACGDNVWDELPRPVSTFIAQYFPGQGVSSYQEVNDTHVVKLDDSATLTFNSSYDWISINGNGGQLPADLVLDQLPADLYDYLESVEEDSNVYSMSRNRTTYTVELHDTTLSYDIETHTVTYPSASAA